MGGDHPIGEATEPSKQLENPSLRHSKYYFDDQQRVFLVENTFFKVHRYFLVRDSEVFRMMFSCPNPGDGLEGVDDSKPIHLPGITCQQFEALLDFLYEGQSVEDPQRLLDLLSISSFYDFDSAREYAIQTIEENGGLNPVDKIYYANQFDIPQWLTPGYKELCQRDAALTISEAERIGLPTAIRVAEAREQFRDYRTRVTKDCCLPMRNKGGTHPMDAIINNVFFNGKT